MALAVTGCAVDGGDFSQATQPSDACPDCYDPIELADDGPDGQLSEHSVDGEPSVGCGNGIVEGAEHCDDGNTIADDGCSTLCALEFGWYCDGEPSACLTACGDGRVAGRELCDDGNHEARDGCNKCSVESGWSCALSPSVCGPVCGDGIVMPGFENCDDGNTRENDGCSSDCAIDHGWYCTGSPSFCKVGECILRADGSCS